jgi:RNA polymerase sigma-70 factor (ECF subfamily)
MNVASRYEPPGQGIVSSAAEPDESLLAAVAAGAEEALGELMRRHRRGVSSVVRRIVPCPADAEEVVQDVFVVVWKHAVRFRGEAKVTTWIHTIARNTAFSRLRQSRSTPSIDVLLRDPGFLVSQRRDPECEALAAELGRQLMSTLAKLSVVHRAVLVGIVRYPSAAKFAEGHHIVIGTVKSRLHRARQALRAALLAS